MEIDSRLNNDFVEAQKKYNHINAPVFQNGIWCIKGNVDVIDANGVYWDTYTVEILIPLNYPISPPVLVETGGKIQRTADWQWHVGNNGECCLGTPAQIYRELRDGITLLKWMDRFVVPFLANHIHRVELGSYANGEFSHGVKGVFEDYSDLLQLFEVGEVVKMLRLMTGKDLLSKNVDCFCGSGKKYKRCYLLEPNRHLLGIPSHILSSDLDKLKNYS